jgi:phenylacetate-coenzyme A ligase PaaK-like adenylate-forming protein
VPAGTPGAKWLLTNLYNRVQPLIRYEVDDVLTLSPEPCACGRPFALIASIGGRSDEVLRLPASEGAGEVPVQPLALEMAVEGVAEVSEYAVRCGPAEILVTAAPRPGADGEAVRVALAEALTAALRHAGARPPPVRVELVERFERRAERMGKRRLVTVEKGDGG